MNVKSDMDGNHQHEKLHEYASEEDVTMVKSSLTREQAIAAIRRINHGSHTLWDAWNAADNAYYNNPTVETNRIRHQAEQKYREASAAESKELAENEELVV